MANILETARAKPANNYIKINGAHIIEANVIADNGILHVIDKVLVPPFTWL